MKTRPSRRQTAKVSHSRWLAYATASAATALAGSHSLEAAIHYSGILKELFPARGVTLKTFQLDQPGDFFQLIHGSAFGLNDSGFAGFHISGIASYGEFRRVPCGCQQYYVSKLSFGQNISSGQFHPGFYFGTMAARPRGGSFQQWRDRGVGFVGFRFNSGAGIQYGWARIKMGGRDKNNPFALIDFAYGDPGEPVSAGQKSSNEQAPDQGSLGWLALGAVGLLAWRKNRSRFANVPEPSAPA